MQRNWIGRSVGAEVDFVLDVQRQEEEDASPVVTVFTTRPDTLHGATYMVLAPEHPLVERITSDEQKDAVAAYQQQVAAPQRTVIEWPTSNRKVAVSPAATPINPANDARIPVYIADYVMMGYGTGAIMAVPGHDQRDFDFAKAFNLPIIPVVAPEPGAARPAAKQQKSALDTIAKIGSFPEAQIARAVGQGCLCPGRGV